MTRSNFKSETNFGFLSPNYMGHVTCLFVKTQNGFVWPVFPCFIFVSVLYLASFFKLKINVLVGRTRITSINLVCDYRLSIIKQ